MSAKEKTTNSHEEQSIDLLDLFFYLLKRWYLLLACTVIGAIGMGYLTYTEVIPLYRSSSQLFFVKTGTIESLYDLQFGSMMSEDFLVIARSKPVIDTTIEKLYEKDGVQMSRGEALGSISVSEVENTHIIQFDVVHTDPKIACDLCNALTEVMQDQIAYIMNADKPTLVEAAEENPYPINGGVNNNRQIMIGAAGGFMICAVILAVLYMIDDKINTAEDVERYIGATVLVSVPYDRAQTFERNSKTAKKSRKKG